MSWLKTISKAFTEAKPIFEGVSAIAGAAGAVAPLILQATAPDTPAAPAVKTAEELEMEAAAAAADKRREIARRRGTGSTYRTSRLGVTSDVFTRRPTLGGI